MIDLAPGDLFRRHVSRGAHHHAGLREAGRTERRSAGFPPAHILCQSKIQNLNAAIGGNHYIRGFQIAMHDTLFMRSGERVGKCTCDFDDLLDGKAARRNQVVQRLPFDKFHRQEMNAAAFFHRINGDDVRVV